MPMKKRKGQLSPSTVVSLVIIAIAGAIGAQILNSILSTFTALSLPANITTQGLTALVNFFDLLPVLGTILIAAIVIAALFLLQRGR
jgi:hypothetical protein